MSQASSSASPLSAASFIGSIGINTHVGYAWSSYNNLALVSESLKYLGVNTLRDNMIGNSQAQPLMTALAQAGYKFDLIVSSGTPAGGAPALARYVDMISSFAAANPKSIVALEGLNEANIQKFSYGGSWSMPAANQFQSDFYAALKSNVVLKDIPVYNLTLAHDDKSAFTALGDTSASSDYANAHSYVSTNTTVKATLANSLALAQGTAGDAPLVITETGYTSAFTTADVGASEIAQAKLILNTLVTAFKSGVEKTYLYELLDRNGTSPSTGPSSEYGLFKTDGSPKLAATGVHNLTRILADDGTGAKMPTATLAYTVTGLPDSGDSMQLAKSNGAYDIVIWASPKVWDDAKDIDIVNPTRSVTVQFQGTQSKIYVYDPMGGTMPIAVYTNVDKIVLPISDHPLVVEVGGPGPQQTGPVTTAPVVRGTAAEIVAQLDVLDASTTLQKIVVTDGHTLAIASKATLDFILGNYKTALSKLEGSYEFAVTQTAATWQKTELYDSVGKLLATTNAGIKNGVIYTQQTKWADGTLQTVNFANGAKSNEQIVHTDGSRESYAYGIVGKPYATEHTSFDASGKRTTFEQMRQDGSLVFSEKTLDGHKVSSWYNDRGVIRSRTDIGPDGSQTVTAYVDGQTNRVYVKHTDNTNETYIYQIKGQSYVTEIQRTDAFGKIVDVQRLSANGTVSYHWETSVNGSTATTLYSATGIKTSQVTVSSDGTRTTDSFTASGKLAKEVIQKADGSITTVTFNEGVKTAAYLVGSDGSKYSEFYAANGLKTSETAYATDGTVATKIYTTGVLSKLFVTYPDKSQVNSVYNITGKSYVTEVQKFDASGNAVDILRSHADGSPDYHWTLRTDGTKITTSYDAKGKVLNIVTLEADGDTLTQTFDAASGKPTKTVLSEADGDVATTLYTAGIVTAVYKDNADGSKFSQLFDTKGVITSANLQAADGHVEASVYTAGVLTKLFVTYPDKSQVNTVYNITGKSYVTEVQKFDASGNAVDILRSHADGSPDYHWTLRTDGTKITTSYDAKGKVLNIVTLEADGDTLTQTFDAASGKPTKTVLSEADGDVATTLYTAGIVTAVYKDNADGSKFSQLFDTKGVITSANLQAADGHVEASVYTAGVLTKLFVTYPDKSQVNSVYNITGKSYVTEVQKFDASGNAVDILRSHADGSPDYHWTLHSDGTKITTSYDARGHTLSVATLEADGDTLTQSFDPLSGKPTKTVMVEADGDVATTLYTAGVVTAVYQDNVDGSKFSQLFDTKGVITSANLQAADGHVEASVYTAGVLTKLFVTYPDKSQANSVYNITGKSYVTEVQKFDASGNAVDILRSHADGSPDYHWTLRSDGTKITTTYDLAGTKTTELIQSAAGAKDVFNFVVPGQPGITKHESFDAAGKLLLTDLVDSDGGHRLYANASGVTLHGGDGDDTANLFGGDTFIFAHGVDKITNFHADEAVANHDLIQISKSLAVNFDALQITKVGSDTLITFNDHDQLILKGIPIGQVNAADFLFV